MEIKETSTAIFIEPLLNSHLKTYQDVITFSNMPQGPVKRLIKSIRPPKLSPFKKQTLQCKFVLMRSSMSSDKTFLTAGDLPSVMAYLHSNGYVVDTHIPTDMSMSGIYLGGDKCGEGERKRCVAIIHYPR